LEHQTRAILFDLDGTLIDTTDLILQCFQFSWAKVCGFEHSREALIGTFGTPLRDAMYRLLDHGGFRNGILGAEAENSTVEELLGAYRAFNVLNHDALARPFEGTREVLAELRRRGYSIVVVTSKGRELGLRGLKLCSLDDLLDFAIFLEDTAVHKPHPEPILVALERLNTHANTAVYVGDSRHDIIAARAAGVRTVGALWGPSPRTELEREGPSFVAESITDLLEIFN
jgi:pyrophosphatase PpaX